MEKIGIEKKIDSQKRAKYQIDSLTQNIDAKK